MRSNVAGATIADDVALPRVDPARAAELYRAELGFVWRSLRRLGVPDSSLDDATHEVFLIAVRKLESFEGRSSPKTWLFGIALHIAQKLGRSRRRRFEELPEELEDPRRAGPLESALRDEAVRTLYALLDRLHPSKRAVFVMVDIEQMSAVEVAEASGLPLNTVYSRLRAARAEFEAALQRARARDDWRMK